MLWRSDRPEKFVISIIKRKSNNASRRTRRVLYGIHVT
jgi:hypothetical protein